MEENMHIMDDSVQTIRQQVADAGRRLIAEQLVAGTWGNISIRVDDKLMVVTPSGIGYATTTADDMVVVDYHTKEVITGGKPSSEYKLHVQVYRERKEINAVIHTHSLEASTVAAARREVPLTEEAAEEAPAFAFTAAAVGRSIPPILDDMAQIIGPSIKVAKYALPSTNKIVKETLKALKGRNGALMANHGAIGLGRDLEEAFTACIILEKACKAFIEAEFLGGAKSINRFEAAFMHQYYLRKYSKQQK